MKVNERKLENFIAALRPENLRQSLLGMFGKAANVTESTDILLEKACDPVHGKVSQPYRERLCERLYQLNEAKKSPVEQRLEGADPVILVQSVCPTESSERKFCTRRPAGRMNIWQAACESAGCCFDKNPPGPRNKLLWKDFCFSKVEQRQAVTVPIKQVDETDEEHQSLEAINCDVSLGDREFCTVRPNSLRMGKIREACENAGCCFALNGNKLFGRWKQSCYKPGN